jgi:predicted RNA-binding protein YlxR (DUF448 family)
VRDPGGQVHLDTTGRANGRGAYVCRDLECIQTATARGHLARALTASVPATLAAELSAVMTHEATTEGSSRGGFIGQE